MKAETAGIEANVGGRGCGTVKVVQMLQRVYISGGDKSFTRFRQMVKSDDVQAFDVQNGTVTTAVREPLAMAQNDSMA